MMADPNETTLSLSARYNEPVRPLEIGLSIGHPRGSVGTLGAFVRRRNIDRLAILSTASAIAPPRAEPGHYIHQPSPRDVDFLTDDTRIATLAEFASPTMGTDAVTDAAVANLLDNVTVRGNVIPVGKDAGLSIEGIADVVGVGDAVAKVGRTTGLTEGTITTTRFRNLRVILGDNKSTVFREVIEVCGARGDPFSGAGDAGALVWRIADRMAVGLVFAGNGERSYLLPIAEVCNLLDLELA